MTVLKHKEFQGWLGKVGDGFPQFILVSGEGVLVKEVLEGIQPAFLKGEDPAFAMESVDGASVPMGDIMEQATTFSFLMARKLILVKNAPLFSNSSSQGEINYTQKDLDLLSDHLGKGLPQGHCLIFTSKGLDRRKKIFKAIDKNGLVIDCTVSQGSRKADLDEQQAVLQAICKKSLAGTGKKIDPNAFHLLIELMGFNPDLLVGNLEKLAAYAGQNPVIDRNAVKAVIKRDKKDPIFSLTNAVMDRDIGQSMFFLSSLLGEGFHPLQILKALENQVRKLLLAKSFTRGLARELNGFRMAGMNFNTFKQQIFPRILSQDKEQKEMEKERDALLESPEGKGKKPPASDLLLAPNPKSPYPVFQVLLKSEKFSLKELRHALMAICDLDHALKSSSLDPVIGIENFVMTLCSQGGSNAQNQNRGHHFQP
ncbi:MAG: DNA polymerase III subunit delta [Desulfobacterales bacterium]|nr:DNA polymerase III subunit delta [Desulfobacterales bacterium]